MGMHPRIVVTGSFAKLDDPVVDLLVEIDDLDRDQAAKALEAAGGQPVPFVAIVDEIPISETAHALCDDLGVDPDHAAGRAARPERVIAASHNSFLQESLEACACETTLALMARFARAGAQISLVP